MTNNFKFLRIFLVWLSLIAFSNLYADIKIDATNLNNAIPSYSEKRNHNFSITITYNKVDTISLTYKIKNITYTVVNWGGAASQELFASQTLNTATLVRHFQMTNDAIDFTLKLTNGSDTTKYLFTVYAKNYIAVMPAGGLAFMKFNAKNYYYAPEPHAGDPLFYGDSSYTYNLKSEPMGGSCNIYLGGNYNFVFSNKFSCGITTAFGYNFGTTTSPINSLLGLNLCVGGKVKFNLGGGCTWMKIKTIPKDIASQQIVSTFSSPPAVPSGIEKWMRGYYISLGVTLATLTN